MTTDTHMQGWRAALLGQVRLPTPCTRGMRTVSELVASRMGLGGLGARAVCRVHTSTPWRDARGHAVCAPHYLRSYRVEHEAFGCWDGARGSPVWVPMQNKTSQNIRLCAANTASQESPPQARHAPDPWLSAHVLGLAVGPGRAELHPFCQCDIFVAFSPKRVFGLRGSSRRAPRDQVTLQDDTITSVCLDVGAPPRGWCRTRFRSVTFL